MFAGAGMVLMFSVGCQPYTDANSCVDWVWFENAQDQFDSASLVVVGTPLKQDGTTQIYGHEAQAHLVTIETVLKGDIEPGTHRISSMPEACGDAAPYPEGDPLDTDRRLLIFASTHEGNWYTMTPAHGVQPFDQGDDLPFEITRPSP